MSDNTVKKQGGARSGCGRKAMKPEEKRQMVSAKVAPETKEMIKDMRTNMKKESKSLGMMIDEIVAKEYKKLAKG